MIDTHISDCRDCQTRLEKLTDSEQVRQWQRLLGESDPGGSPEQPWPAVPAEQANWDALLELAMRDQGFELLDLIGRGGMGQVFRARQKSPARVVAIKMLRNSNADPSDLNRFFREADAIAGISHPNVVKIFQVGECLGRPFLVLEHVDGPSLAQFIAGKTLEPATAASWMIQIARGVEHAHRVGILHRDLKPANLLLAPVGHLDQPHAIDAQPPPEQLRDAGQPTTSNQYIPKVADFGLARPIKLEENAANPTHTRQLLGTPLYMSPEQIAGQNDRLDHGTDIYALGVILYEMLTGTVPFRGSSQYQLLKNIETQEPRRLRTFNRNTPADLEAICLKCLEKTPSRRYQSAACLANDLERYLNGHPVEARRISTLDRWRKRAWRHPKVTSLGVCLVLALLVLIFLAPSWLTQRTRSASQYRSSLARAQEMVDKAESSPLIEVAAWQAALNMSEQARELERSVSHRSAQPAGQLVEQSRQHLRDHQLARELEDLWIQAIIADNLPPEQSLTEQYRTCFANYGLDLQGSVKRAKQQLELKPARFRSRMLTAIHHFHMPLPDGSEKQWCRELLLELEDNPWRRTLFETVDRPNLTDQQVQILTSLLETPDVSVGPESLAFAASYLVPAKVPPQQIVQYLKHCQQVHADSLWLNYFLAKCIRLVDSPTPAIPFARAAVAQCDRPSTRTFLAGHYYDSGLFAEAETELLNALQQDPDFEPAQFALAECYQRQQEFDRAIAAYRQLLRRAAGMDRLAGKLLGCYVQAGMTNQAEVFANDLIQGQDDDHAACHARAEAFNYLGNATAAIAEYERAIAHDPTCLHCYLELASIYERQKLYAKAEQPLQTFLDYLPTGIEAGRRLIDAYLEQQKNESAVSLALERTRQLGSVPSVWRDLGRVHIRLGQDNLAEQAFQQVLSIQANDVSALVQLGKIHHRQKRYSVAESEFRAAIRQRPESELANGGLIDFLFMLRRNDEAVLIARRLAELRPQSVYAQWKFMEALRTAGRYREAIEVFDSGADLESQPAAFFTPAKRSRLEYCRQVSDEYQRLGDVDIESLSAEQATAFSNVVLAPRGNYGLAAEMTMHAIQDRETMSSDGLYFSAVFESALLSLLASQMSDVSEDEQQRLRIQAIEQLEAFVEEFGTFVEQRPDFASQHKSTWRLIPDNAGIAALREERLLLNLPKSQAERCRKLWRRFEAIIEEISVTR